LTAVDVGSIDDAVKDDDALLTEAVRLALRTLNVAGEWKSFRDTARELMRVAPARIPNYAMFLAGL
uniref:hypothetical protein n=1 Tax=Aquisphaera insulae TaxID=2712864 RepID=UPI0013E9DFDC